MANDYQTYGERRMIDGVAHYSRDERSDGMTYGYVYWNEQAFMEQPDEVLHSGARLRRRTAGEG